MDKYHIGEIAGLVWHALENRKAISVQELSRMLSQNVIDVAMAIGWLAREDKVYLRTKDNITFVSLYNIFDYSFG